MLFSFSNLPFHYRNHKTICPVTGTQNHLFRYGNHKTCPITGPIKLVPLREPQNHLFLSGNLKITCSITGTTKSSVPLREPLNHNQICIGCYLGTADQASTQIIQDSWSGYHTKCLGKLIGLSHKITGSTETIQVSDYLCWTNRLCNARNRLSHLRNVIQYLIRFIQFQNHFYLSLVKIDSFTAHYSKPLFHF